MEETWKTRIKVLKEIPRLPEPNEVIITKEGLILIDIAGPLKEEDLGESIGEEILCG